MATVYVGIGSNIDPENNIHLCMSELRRRYGELQASAVYRSQAVGFEGDDFLNLVASFESEESPAGICEVIETIHDLVGRSREGGKWASRPLDIDLLLYDDLVMNDGPVRVPREDILEYSFVLRPLAELAPDLLHPVTRRTMFEHWQAFDDAGQPLEPVGIIL